MTGDTLNLLPREDLRNISYEKLSRVGLGIHVLIAIMISTGAVLLLPTYFFLTFQEHDVVRQINITKQSTEIQRVEKAEAAIKAINEKVRLLSSTTLPEPAASYLTAVRTHTPANVSITRLSFSRKDNTVEVQGAAETREDFLRFVAALHTDPLFQEISSPISNILKERKLTFTVSITARTP